MTKDVQPFLASIASAQAAPRPFGAALPSVATPPSTSPWSPKLESSAPQAQFMSPSLIDVAAIRAEAIEQGRAEGLRETEALRTKLTAALEQIEATRTAMIKPAAELVANAAATIVEAWSQTTDRKTVFAPIVAAWLARDRGTATVHVHPADVSAMREAVGEATLVVVGDPSIEAGDVMFESEAFELAHRWADRLDALRTAIASAL
ncbi:MAG: FliH/SctL family protein [Kofleriaceae bacterium]